MTPSGIVNVSGIPRSMELSGYCIQASMIIQVAINKDLSRMLNNYTLVIQHSYGESQLLIGKTHYKWQFSKAFLNYQKVCGSMFGKMLNLWT